ncbi:hypothetical protein RYZ27_06675 [Hyphomonas sp. FCG-A18]|uniref:hypothetical protein n=1 Tax=Hyphomonas sp. FCG-A18 TaxID=3080019 RepID=UPI002B31BE7C|nr:hypothetical protein RYZ27_06675 [Hyphomonas sp. FCG-A18]
MFNLRTLRWLAIGIALTLLLAEVWRVSQLEREWLLILEDVVSAGLLLIAAIWITRDGIRQRALFAAAWMLNAALLYVSFHTQWFRNADILSNGLGALGPVDIAVAGLMMACLFGLALTVWLPPEDE